MASKRRIFHRRRFPLHVLLLSAAVLWAVLWFGGAWHLQRQTNAFMEREQSKGHNITMESSRCGGSPFAVTRRIKGLVWRFGERGSLKAKDVSISLRPWNWLSYNAVFEEGLEIFLSSTEQDGLLLFQSPQASVTLTAPLFLPKDHRKASLALNAQAGQIDVKSFKPLPFGHTIANAGVDLRVMGPLPDFADNNSVSAWNANSGVIEIDSLKLSWGPLGLNLNGTLALNNELQPEGAFSGYIQNRRDVVKALAHVEWIANNDAVLLNAALDTVSKGNKSAGKETEEISITAQSGALYVGPVRVMTLPPLTWK